MAIDAPILVTGAAGRLGVVGRDVVEILRRRNLPVRALVHREEERADALRAMGAEVVVGDLTRVGDVARALAGCRRMYFGMSVSAPYLEATVTSAAVARQRGDLEVFVNISQMVDVPLEQWRDQELRSRKLPDHVFEHLLTMARLHADNRYDRLTHDVETITGRPATSVRDFVAHHPEVFRVAR
jgi:hypothetical protein